MYDPKKEDWRVRTAELAKQDRLLAVSYLRDNCIIGGLQASGEYVKEEFLLQACVPSGC